MIGPGSDNYEKFCKESKYQQPIGNCHFNHDQSQTSRWLCNIGIGSFAVILEGSKTGTSLAKEQPWLKHSISRRCLKRHRSMPAVALSTGWAISLTRNSALWIGSSGCSLYLPSLVLLLPWHGTFGLSGETNRLQKIYLLGTFVDWRLHSKLLRIYITFAANFYTKNRSWQS